MYRHTECEVCGKGFVIGATTNAPVSGPSGVAEWPQPPRVSRGAIKKGKDRSQRPRIPQGVKNANTSQAATKSSSNEQVVTPKNKKQWICARCGAVSEEPPGAENIGCLILMIPIVLLAVGWFLGGILRYLNHQDFDEECLGRFVLSFLAMICVGIVTLVAIKVYGRCPLCKNTNCRVDLESPMGKKLFKELHSENGAG